jgi:DnaJ-class molecular chaperone
MKEKQRNNYGDKTKCYPCNGTGKVRFFNSTISICNLCQGKGYLNIKQGVAWKNITQKIR